MKHMKIGYARVSTVEQNLDLQIKALKEAGCEKIYSEKLSALRVLRPELEEALRISRAGDTLVVWKLDRLGRRTTDLLEFIEKLGERGVGFHSISDGIDPSSAIGKAVFTIAAAFSELERDILLERTNRGIAAAKEKGVKFGRPRKIDTDDIKNAITLLDTPDVDGNIPTLTAVAKTLKTSKSTLSRRLKEYR